MRKIVAGMHGLLAAVLWTTAAQAAPVTYQATNWWHLHETHRSADGGSVPVVGMGEFLVAYAVPLSIIFTYDSAAQLTPTTPQPDTPEVDHLQAFDAHGALTNISGNLGGQSFGVTASTTTNFSYIALNIHPGTTVSSALGMVGPVAGGGAVFARASDGQTFRLTDMSFSFGSGPDVSVLPLQPVFGFSPAPYAELLFTGEHGDTVSAKYYLGTLTAIPLPGAAWLFGSAVLAPLVLRMRRKQ